MKDRCRFYGIPHSSFDIITCTESVEKCLSFEGFGRLRAAVHTPTLKGWGDLVALIPKLRLVKDDGIIIDYLEFHLKAWPERILDLPIDYKSSILRAVGVDAVQREKALQQILQQSRVFQVRNMIIGFVKQSVERGIYVEKICGELSQEISVVLASFQNMDLVESRDFTEVDTALVEALFNSKETFGMPIREGNHLCSVIGEGCEMIERERRVDNCANAGHGNNCNCSTRSFKDYRCNEIDLLSYYEWLQLQTTEKGCFPRGVDLPEGLYGRFSYRDMLRLEQYLLRRCWIFSTPYAEKRLKVNYSNPKKKQRWIDRVVPNGVFIVINSEES